jgi:transposase InsO family protein
MRVPRSTYYDVAKRLDAPEPVELKWQIREIYDASKGSYGYRRVLDELRDLGYELSRRDVIRLMREMGIWGKATPKFRVTTKSKHSHRIAPNLLQRDFSPDAMDRVWATDITYLAVGSSFLYLAVVLDLYSRRVVGYSLASHLGAKLCLDALEMAFGQRRPEAGWIHHSDRGVQYASNAYRMRVEDAGGILSMSGKGDCWDNACVESFFASLKKEWLRGERINTKDAMRREVTNYLRWYNARRKHSTLNYRSPMQFEREAELTLRQAA